MTSLILMSLCKKEISPRNVSKERELLFSTALLNKRSLSHRGVQLYACLSMLGSHGWTPRTALLHHKNSAWRSDLELKFGIPQQESKKCVYGIIIKLSFFYLMVTFFYLYLCLWAAWNKLTILHLFPHLRVRQRKCLVAHLPDCCIG